MAPYKSGALMRSKYYTSFYKTPLKWIPRSKSGASKSRPRWAAHIRIGNVWEYPPRGANQPSNNWNQEGTPYYGLLAQRRYLIQDRGKEFKN